MDRERNVYQFIFDEGESLVVVAHSIKAALNIFREAELRVLAESGDNVPENWEPVEPHTILLVTSEDFVLG